MNWKKKAIIGVAILMVLWMFSAMFGGGDSAGRIYKTVKEEAFTRKVATTGIVKVKDETEIRAGVTCQVEAFLVEEGDLVKAGDVLLQLDDSHYKRAAHQAKLRVNGAENRLEKSLKENKAKTLELTLAVDKLEMARSVHKDAELQYQRYQNLFKKNVLAKKNLEKSELELQNAKTGLSHAQTNKELAQINLELNNRRIRDAKIELQDAKISCEEALDNFDKCAVKSEIDGMVLKKMVEDTAYVNVGVPLISVGNINELILEMEVDEGDAGEVGLGQAVEIEVESTVNTILMGKIYKFARQADVDNNVSYFPAEASFKDENGLLKPGMTVDAQILTIVRDKAITLPLSAVIKEQTSAGNKSWVFVEEDNGDVKRVAVDAGSDNNRDIVIESGLQIGDRVIVGSYDLLQQLNEEVGK
jgi:multidrug efflux pump subunit AcrA (membrane-fusion protein)